MYVCMYVCKSHLYTVKQSWYELVRQICVQDKIVCMCVSVQPAVLDRVNVYQYNLNCHCQISVHTCRSCYCIPIKF